MVAFSHVSRHDVNANGVVGDIMVWLSRHLWWIWWQFIRFRHGVVPAPFVKYFSPDWAIARGLGV